MAPVGSWRVAARRALLRPWFTTRPGSRNTSLAPTTLVGHRYGDRPGWRVNGTTIDPGCKTLTADVTLIRHLVTIKCTRCPTAGNNLDYCSNRLLQDYCSNCFLGILLVPFKLLQYSFNRSVEARTLFKRNGANAVQAAARTPFKHGHEHCSSQRRERVRRHQKHRSNVLNAFGDTKNTVQTS